MLVEAGQLSKDQELETDLCVVGAGAAGISIALALAKSGLDLTLLESGGFEPDAATRRLYEGQVLGAARRFGVHYLTTSRQRLFGGSTNCWAGVCHPLDPLDFAKRDWIEGSGWPFGSEALEPFYTEAARLCEIHNFDYQPAEVLRQMQPDHVIFERGPLRTQLFHSSPPTCFGSTYREKLLKAPKVSVVIHANVIELRLDGERVVQRLRAVTLGGRRFTVRARAYVLACGAIENARLLLASNRQHRKGLGNHNDLVGRYFMEHPWGPIAYWATTKPKSSMRFHTTGGVPNERLGCPVKAVLMPSPEAQRKHRIANFYAMLGSSHELKIDTLLTKRHGQEYLDVSPLLHGPASFYPLFLVREQVPNRNNRVMLSLQRDALGMPRVKLVLRFSPMDHKLIGSASLLIGGELGRRGLGRLLVLTNLRRQWLQLYVASHHMGTTRAHLSDKHGVVGADLKVHGLANLYVAGSSVFPTAGAANPTFTIVALALRLAAHLEKELRT